MSMRCSLGRRAVLLATSASLLVGLNAAAAGADPIKLMLLGDSITQGGQGFAGYRYTLYESLKNNGFNVDYVGSVTQPYLGVAPNAAMYPNYNTTFDKDVEGHWGYRTGQILNDGAGFTLAGAAGTYVPDVVAITLGTNDVGNGVPLATSMTNYGQIIDTLRAANPNVKILVSKIPDLRPGAYNNQYGAIPGYNAGLTTLAATKSTAQSPVRIVDQYVGFDGTGMMQGDGVHPNLYGENLMADRFYRELQQYLAPGAPRKNPAIRVANGNFSDGTEPGTFDGAVYTLPSKQAWKFTPKPGAGDGGIWNPTAAFYPSAGGNNAAQGATGEFVSYLFNTGSGVPTAGAPTIEQTMAAVLEANTDYTLTAAIGKRLEPNGFGSTYGGYRLQLLAGGVVIGESADLITPAAGTFADATFTVPAGSVPTALLGQELGIRLMMTGTAQGMSTDFDNVRLTSALVPEPAVLSTVAVLGVAVVRRRRRL